MRKSRQALQMMKKEINARHILVEDEKTADEVLQN